MVDEVRQMLLTFAKFEKDGTLPNTIHGDDVSNRDTSDAPLWFALACEELPLEDGAPASLTSSEKRDADTSSYDDFIQPVDTNRTIRDVLVSIAENYAQRHAQRHPHGHGFRADLESEPFHLDGHEPSRRHAARRVIRSKFKCCGFACCASLKKSVGGDGQKKWRDAGRPRDGFV